jgi:hypothetical protein
MHCVAMMNGVSYLIDNTNIVTESNRDMELLKNLQQQATLSFISQSFWPTTIVRASFSLKTMKFGHKLRETLFSFQPKFINN